MRTPPRHPSALVPSALTFLALIGLYACFLLVRNVAEVEVVHVAALWLVIMVAAAVVGWVWYFHLYVDFKVSELAPPPPPEPGGPLARWTIAGTYVRGSSTGPWVIEARSAEAARREAEALGIIVSAVTPSANDEQGERPEEKRA